MRAEVTQVLARLNSGDQTVSEELLPLVYDELRRLAALRMKSERTEHTLQPTALVHEAYLRLVTSQPDGHWDSRTHFFAAAAEAMRRILIERARRRARRKNGGAMHRMPLSRVSAVDSRSPEFMLMISEALERIECEDPRLATLVKLRFFVGMSLKEAADVLRISRSTATEDWAYARARLRVLLENDFLPPATS